MDWLLRNPTLLLFLNCCGFPLITFAVGVFVGIVTGRGYRVRFERG